jgi:uncharacterized integral membrane protein (TIGR00697 family)
MTLNLKITTHDNEWQPTYFAAMTGLFCGLYMITMAMNAKLIDVYGFILPVGIVTFPLCAIITDILTEVYGFNRARQAIWTVLVCTVLFAAFTQLAILLPAASFWTGQSGYAAIFGTSLRLAAAGCAAWVAGEFSNSFIMSKMKILQNARLMPVRFIGSTIVGQFFDTLVFGTVAFAGTMPVNKFIGLIVSIWLIKIAYEIVVLPLSVPITNWIKRLEGVEHFDRQEIHIL